MAANGFREMDCPFGFEHRGKVGYTGWVGYEYNPAAATLEGLGWFAPYARRGRAAAPRRENRRTGQ